MTVARIGPKHQITIPQEAFDELGLQPGDFLEVQVAPDGLLLVPQKLVPRDQAWFWTEEWQASEQEATAAIARGEVSGPFETVDELVKHLRSEK